MPDPLGLVNRPHTTPPGALRRRLVAAVAGVAMLSTACAQLQTLSAEDALGRLNIATTKLYAADSSLIANLHGEINRDIVPLERIPAHVQDAVIAIEDERFWVHPGVDVKSIGRALLENVQSATTADGGLQGGSTISQQLVKNLYFAKPERTVERKLAEARVTVQFERQYSKREILEMYLNTIYLGRGLYGFQTAAKSYFQKDAEELSLAEGAFLAGIINEPARYDFSNESSAKDQDARREAGIARRGVVLRKMVSLGMIDEQAGEHASAEPLRLRAPGEAEWQYPYFVDMVLRQLGVLRNSRSDELDPRFSFLGDTFQERARNLYRGGLRIYTTLDPRMQAVAEEAVERNIPEKIDRLSAALTAIEPATGYVRAIVGGRDYYPDCEEGDESTRCKLAKVNLALGDFGGGSGRQAGSSFKPFVLAAALEHGVSLRTRYSGSPFTQKIQGSAPWKVSNYEGSGGGSMSLVEATVNSVNAAYARLEVDGIGQGDPLKGSRAVAQTARELGIPFTTPAELKKRCGDRYGRSDACIPADEVPAIALGAKEVAAIDMTAAYATIANDGVRVQPTAVLRITDSKGKTIYEADPVRRRALPRGVARGVTHVLRQVVDRGTGVKARIDRPAAGKTGTSQEWRDAWFVGYTPHLAAAVWVGGCRPGDRRCLPESMTPKNGYPFKVVGGSFPAQTWAYFMRKALADVPIEDFEKPPPEILNAVPKHAEGELAVVPDVLGFGRIEAADALSAAGFTVAETQCLAPGVRDGVVVKQTPPGGVEFEQGSAVNICVSVSVLPQTNPTPAPWWVPGAGGETQAQDGVVPSVVGKNRARAQADVANAGFESVAVAECDASGAAQPGFVWRQSPGPGTTMRKGSNVTMWYQPPGCAG